MTAGPISPNDLQSALSKMKVKIESAWSYVIDMALTIALVKLLAGGGKQNDSGQIQPKTEDLKTLITLFYFIQYN